MKKDLAGKKVVVTRTRNQASALVELLEDRGADVIEIPTIRISDPADIIPRTPEASRGLERTPRRIQVQARNSRYPLCSESGRD